MRVLLLVAALAGLAAAYDSEFYRGSKIYSAVPKDEKDVSVLADLREWTGVDFFSNGLARGKEIKFMAAASQLSVVEEALNHNGISYEIVSHDAQETVNAEQEENRLASARAQIARMAKASSIITPSFTSFMRHAEIETYLEYIASAYPNLVTLASAGNSYEGRRLTVVCISKNKCKSSRAVWVDSAIHAREWIAPPVALYLIHMLTSKASTYATMLDDLDWYIMPVMNPDGYEYSHTTERLWRKNRGKTTSSRCIGSDLNRNFGYHWGETGVSSNPCSLTYPGKTAFSEVESINVRDYILNINANGRVKMYLSLHSYGQYFLYPYGYNYWLADAPDKAELVTIANAANAAIVKAGSDKFSVINSADLYPASGASDDWAKGVADIAKAFTIELHGGGSAGFNIPASRIANIVKQMFAGFQVFAKYAKTL